MLGVKPPKINKIKELSVAGYKSIYEEQKIRVAPLTILAGANSSGKSSFMQPFLLMKQTLESPYDAGVFLLDGENVTITDIDQMMTRLGTKNQLSEFSISIIVDNGDRFSSCYEKIETEGLNIKRQEFYFSSDKKNYTLFPKMRSNDIEKVFKYLMGETVIGDMTKNLPQNYSFQILMGRIFLTPQIQQNSSGEMLNNMLFAVNELVSLRHGIIQAKITLTIKNIIHLPGLRGNPERAYPKLAIYKVFPGRFEVYTASIIHHWQSNKETEKIQELENSLQYLGLTSKIEVKQIYDTRIEIHVGRLPTAKKGRSKDMVNIADVGFGVSQTLPILVALIQAKPEHTVYIEQPETHLHPKAQYQLAELFAKAAKRGVRLIIETHSSLIIQGIQTLVAKGEFAPKDVALHWFSRDKSGATKIDSAELDENGAFGDWPEDFDDTFLKADSAYLDAVESKF